MKFRKLMLVFTITVSIIFITVIGATYAYYSTSAGGLSVTTGSSDQSLGVVFTNNDYIDLNTGIPISSSEVETKASKTIFSLTPSNNIINGYDINVDINLSNIDIDNALKVSDFKYRLDCTHSVTGNTQTFTGNATSFTGNYYTIASLSTTANGNNIFYIDTNANSQSYNCVLYIWLEESGVNQNSLMGKHFGANIQIGSMMKKR